ncbi:hypothetical protein J2T41_003197 [Pseudomonas citronellolis]|nr:hypothetical protein [Pseudomonas citronellolis]MCP1643573.1 hypothetical protein [Pseudomonas citronellolis]MCP1657764.1 hypothetical protein [Pseudomonas citronellolis]MCP1666499.1 hypothetical protein [Pseudomonas citronellolis]MCP1700416.1 hypothetical protein [Pseudomonas citronellolis]
MDCHTSEPPPAADDPFGNTFPHTLAAPLRAPRS